MKYSNNNYFKTIIDFLLFLLSFIVFFFILCPINLINFFLNLFNLNKKKNTNWSFNKKKFDITKMK